MISAIMVVSKIVARSYLKCIWPCISCTPTKVLQLLCSVTVCVFWCVGSSLSPCLSDSSCMHECRKLFKCFYIIVYAYKCCSIQWLCIAFGEEEGRIRVCDCAHNIDNHTIILLYIKNFFSYLSAPSPSPSVCWRLLSMRKRSTPSFASVSRKREFTRTCTCIVHMYLYVCRNILWDSICDR